MAEAHYEAIEIAFLDAIEKAEELLGAIRKHAVLSVSDAPGDSWDRRQQMRKWNIQLRTLTNTASKELTERIKGPKAPKRDQTGRYAVQKMKRERTWRP